MLLERLLDVRVVRSLLHLVLVRSFLFLFDGRHGEIGAPFDHPKIFNFLSFIARRIYESYRVNRIDQVLLKRHPLFLFLVTQRHQTSRREALFLLLDEHDL